jgi:uncharacterized protein
VDWLNVQYCQKGAGMLRLAHAPKEAGITLAALEVVMRLYLVPSRPMDKKSLVLAAFAPAQGALYSPVQIQKALFLIVRNMPDEIGGAVFNFEPYDYGPFDKTVYDTLEELTREGLVEVDAAPGLRWRRYRLTESGQVQAAQKFAALNERARQYFTTVSKFVRTLSFEQLVSSIYKAYPDMKVNSVFRG